jgi:hypothetical protein
MNVPPDATFEEMEPNDWQLPIIDAARQVRLCDGEAVAVYTKLTDEGDIDYITGERSRSLASLRRRATKSAWAIPARSFLVQRANGEFRLYAGSALFARGDRLQMRAIPGSLKEPIAVLPLDQPTFAPAVRLRPSGLAGREQTAA